MFIFEPRGRKVFWRRISDSQARQGSYLPDDGKLPLEQAAAAAGTPARVIYVLPHGAVEFQNPVTLVDASTLAGLERCVPYWPVENALALAMVKDGLARWPAAQHILLCETAFFAWLPARAALTGLPYDWVADGLRRYGGDGLYHEWAWKQVRQAHPECRRLLSVHLCGRPTAAAILNGRPLDGTQGFTPQEGLPGMDSCGELDPQIILDLARDGANPADLAEMIAHGSGWQALAGKTASLADLATEIPLIDDMLVADLRKALGGLAAVLGTVDVVAFGAEGIVRWPETISALAPALKMIGSGRPDALKIITLEAPRAAVLLSAAKL